MNKVTVNRKEVLEIVKINREEHHGIFLKAQEGYKKEAIRLLEENLEKARKGREYVINLGLYPPVDQTKEYNRAIKMLEMEVHQEVELTQQEFANIVMDEWNWTPSFATSNAMYVARAGGKMPAKYNDYIHNED